MEIISPCFERVTPVGFLACHHTWRKMADGGAPSSSTGKIHFSAAETATLVLEGSNLESIDSLDGWESDDCARGDISLLLSHVLTDSNNVSHDCVPPAKLDQTGDCTSDTEVEIAAVSSADKEPIRSWFSSYRPMLAKSNENNTQQTKERRRRCGKR